MTKGREQPKSRSPKILRSAARRYCSWSIFFVVPSLIMILTSFRFPGEFGGLAPISRACGTAADGEYGFTAGGLSVFFQRYSLCRNFPEILRQLRQPPPLICLVMAYPLALLIARSEKRFRNLMVLLVVLPFASNFLIRIYAWMIILGPESALSHFINAILGLIRHRASNIVVFAICGFGGHGLCASARSWCCRFIPIWKNMILHFWMQHRISGATGGSASGALPGPYPCQACFPAPRWYSFLYSACSRFPISLGGTGDILIGNLIKDQFLGTRDWPFGSVLSIMLTLAVLSVAGLAAWFARSAIGQRAASMNRGTIWLWSAALLVYAFLYIPLAIVIVMYSFNDSRLNAEWVGFTLFWYKALLNNTEMLTGCAQFADYCAQREFQRDGAWHDGRPGDTSVQAQGVAGAGVHAGGHARNPAGRFAAVILFASAEFNAGHGLHHYRAHHFLHRLCRHYRAGTASGHGREHL